MIWFPASRPESTAVLSRCIAIAATAVSAFGLMSPAPASEADPDVTAVQQAYEREAAGTADKHDVGLKVIGADCSRDLSGDYLCWVKFTGSSDQHRSVQSDVVSISRFGTEWKLKSGLCLPTKS